VNLIKKNYYMTYWRLFKVMNLVDLCFPYLCYLVALRTDAGSWSPLTELRDRTHWTHRTW